MRTCSLRAIDLNPDSARRPRAGAFSVDANENIYV